MKPIYRAKVEAALDRDVPRRLDFLQSFVAEDLLPVSEEQARERSEGAVAASIKDLQDVAVPYLDRWLSSGRS